MSRLRAAVAFARSFVRARCRWRRGSREALLAWQERQIARFTRDTLAHVPFYRDGAGRTGTDWPLIDKPHVLAHFAALNRFGIALDDARAVAATAEHTRDFRPTLPGGVTVGLSSGTSGHPGVFLVAPEERAAWAGAMLGTLLTRDHLRQALRPWAPPLRVAFFLRASSNLYTTVHSRRLRFQFFDLLQPLAALTTALHACQPDMLVAPASTLAALARATQAGPLRIKPGQVVSVAETLEADDRRLVRDAWGVTPTEVYQATEGFLGASCEHGRVHLNEAFVRVEPEWLDATRFVPVITDFSRTTQAIVRYRLDDVLVDSGAPCPCGRPTRALAAIEGRCDDVLWLRGRDGERLPVFPDVVRRAMLLAQDAVRVHHGFDDYRVVQRGATLEVRLRMASALVACDPSAGAEGAVRDALDALWRALNVDSPELRFLPWQDDRPGDKRRRIRHVSAEAA